MIHRRRVLIASAAGAAASLAPGWIFARRHGPDPQSGLRRQTLRTLMHTRFSIFDGSSRIEAELIELGDGPVTPGTEQFWIRLLGPRDRSLAEGLYELRHERLGWFALHLQPAGEIGSRPCYRACFSLLV